MMDTNPPEVYEAKAHEMSKLRIEQEVFFQLVLDKTWMRWYLVAVGDQERVIKSEYIVHDPFVKKRSILVFAEVDDSWIRNKRQEYEKAMIYKEAQAWDGQQFNPEKLEFTEEDFTTDD